MTGGMPRERGRSFVAAAVCRGLEVEVDAHAERAVGLLEAVLVRIDVRGAGGEVEGEVEDDVVGEEEVEAEAEPGEGGVVALGGNRFRFHTENVGKFLCRLHPAMADLSAPLKIEVNGRSLTLRADADASHPDYTAKITVEIAD